MNRFEVIQPSTLLASYVKQYWFVTIGDTAYSPQRLVPFEGIILTFHRNSSSRFQSVIKGIHTGYSDIISEGRADFVSIVLQPTGSKYILRLPLCEIKNKHISPDTLSDPELTELEQRLTETVDNLSSAELIEQFLLRRIYKFNKYSNKRIEATINYIYNGETNLNTLIEKACVGYKQFKRIFTTDMGCNPKDYLKIIRFRRFHHLLQQHCNMTVSQMAEECRYYDKSHLIKELKDFTGFTPGQLRNACDPVYSNEYALFRSIFVDLLKE